MHVLTKVFIVLVSLLAVMLVPLVVVYAHNENSYKARFQQAEIQAAADRAALESAKTRMAVADADHRNQNDQLTKEKGDLLRERDRAAADVRRLEGELAQARTLQAEINTKLSTLVTSVDAGQKLNETLIRELSSIRTAALDSQKKVVECEDTVRDVRAQLDVAVEARRAIQEELQRLKEEHAKTMDVVAQYVATYGRVGDTATATTLGPDCIAPDRFMEAAVVTVRRSGDRVLLEIAAGSRDGAKEGWCLTVARGSQFLGRIRLIEVDISRSVGVVSLEDAKRQIREGDVVRAYPARR